MENKVEEQEIFVHSIQRALRPNGHKAVQVTFAFESPFAEVDNERTAGKATIAQISVNPIGLFNKTTPEEIKLILIFSEDEWKSAERKYGFGSTHKIKIKPNGKIEVT